MTNNTDNSVISRILHEPLTHFLLLGAALFILFANVNDTVDKEPDRIVVDATQVQVLADQFQRTWMRPPTRQELQGLAEDFVKEEVLYREALALGLNQNDLIIRRRMRQKMEFLNTDLVEQQKVSDTELQAYLDTHAEEFEAPERVSFQQIYFKTGTDRQAEQARISAALQQLATDPALDPHTLGDTTLLPADLENASPLDISRFFGDTLANSLADAPLDRWSGPYTSTYGQHLVLITERTPARVLSLDEARSAVEREWRTEKKREADERFYQALRSRYSVEIDLPDDTGMNSTSQQTP